MPPFRPARAASHLVDGIQHWNQLGVFDPIIHPQPVFAVLDQTRLAQEHQLLRDIGLALAQECREVADALFFVAECVQQTQPGRVRQRSEDIGGQSIGIHSGF